MDAELLKNVKEGGALLLVAYMIWQGWKREERSATTFADLNKSVAERDKQLVEKLSTLIATLNNRPCVKEDQ